MGKENNPGFISYNEVSEIQKSANREIYMFCKKRLKESTGKIVTVKRLISLVTENDPVKSDLVSLLQEYVKEREMFEKELNFLEGKTG